MNVLRVGGAAAVSVTLFGCATAHPLPPVDTSVAIYRDPHLSDADLKAAGIAVLPVDAPLPRDKALAERVGTRVAIAIQKRQVCAVVVPPADVNTRFARDGVSDRFAKMLSALDASGTLDPETLDEMGRATGCRYFLQSSIRSTMSWDTANVDGCPHTSRAAVETIQAQLWDAATGEVVWEGNGGGAALVNPPNIGSDAQATTIAVNGIAAILGKDPASLPHPRYVQDLHERDHQQLASVNGENASRADAAVTGLQVAVSVLQIAGAIADIAH